MATLSARRAVERRCVIYITVFNLSPVGVLEILVMVSKICACACASRDEVYFRTNGRKRKKGEPSVQFGARAILSALKSEKSRTGSSKTSRSTVGSVALMKARAIAILCH